jgi:hypothetical protein
VTQPAADITAQDGVVLADPSGEDDGLHLRQHGQERRDVLAQAVGVDVQRQLCGVVAIDSLAAYLAYVGAARQPSRPLLLLSSRSTSSTVYAPDAAGAARRRVEVAAARAHDQALQRVMPIDVSMLRPACTRRRGAVADVADDEVRRSTGYSEQTRCLTGDVWKLVPWKP